MEARAALSESQMKRIDDAIVDAQVEYFLNTGYGYRFVQDIYDQYHWTYSSDESMPMREYVLSHPVVRKLVADLRAECKAAQVPA